MPKKINENKLIDIVGNKFPIFLNIIKEVIKKARELGGDVVFLEKNKDADAWSGYFDHENLKIFVFFENNSTSWFPVLIHEFNHLIQYVNRTKASRRYLKVMNEDGRVEKNLLEKLLKADKTKRIKDVDEKMLARLIDFESECDQMSVDMMKMSRFDKRGLVDIDEYIQEANIFFYKLLFLINNHIWVYFSNDGYNKLKKLVPAGRLIDSKSKISKEVKGVFDSEVIFKELKKI